MTIEGVSPALGIGKQESDLSGDADFVTIYTVAALEEHQYGEISGEGKNLKRVAELVAQLSNMNYVSLKSSTEDLSVAATRDFFGLGTDFDQADTVVYTLKFLVEQPGYITEDILDAAFQGVPLIEATTGVPITGPSTVDVENFEVDSATAANINIVVEDTL